MLNNLEENDSRVQDLIKIVLAQDYSPCDDVEECMELIVDTRETIQDFLAVSDMERSKVNYLTTDEGIEYLYGWLVKITPYPKDKPTRRFYAITRDGWTVMISTLD